MKDLLEFNASDFHEAITGVTIPDPVANAIAKYVNNCLMTWEEKQRTLYGRHDTEDGWQMHERPGEFDVFTCKAFGFEEIKSPVNKKVKCNVCGTEFVTAGDKEVSTIIKCPNGCTMANRVD